MSSPNVSVGLNDISKMKVAELKKELKAKGLSTVGTKNELMERLQSADPQVPQDTSSEFDNAEPDVLDEDEVLAGVEGAGEVDDEVAEQTLLGDEPKVKPQQAAGATQKRSLSLTAEPSQESQPKKRVLIRPTSVTNTSEKENGSQEKETQMEVEDEGKADSNEKKVVKLSTVSIKERLTLRAQKFGLPLSDSAKKQARAERFGSAPSTVKTAVITSATKTVLVGPSEEILKKRAARFGCNVSSAAIKVEENEKIKKRQERFGMLSAASVDNLAEKKKLRAERFQL